MTSGKLTSSHSYVFSDYDSNSNMPLAAKITQSTPGGAAMCFEYTYDSRVNIISEKRSSMTTTYVYKTLRKVVRVYDQHDTTSGSNGTTWVYNYDCGGNTLSKERYAYTTGTRGTALQTIPYIYDAIGNPLSDGTWTYT